MGAAESTPTKTWTPAAMYQFPDEYEEDVRAKVRDSAAPGLDLDHHHDSRYPDERALEYSRPEENPHSDGYWRRRDRQHRHEHDQRRLEERAARDSLLQYPTRPVPGATAAHARRRIQQFQSQEGWEREPLAGRTDGQRRQQQQQQQQHHNRRRQPGQPGGGLEYLPTYEEATTDAALMATAAAASTGQLDADAGVMVPPYSVAQATGRRQRRPQPPRQQQQQQQPRPSPQPKGQRRPALQFPYSVSASTSASPLQFSPSSSSPTDGSSHARLTAEALRRQDKLAGHPPRPLLRRSTYSLISELRDEEKDKRVRREKRLRDTQLREASLAYAKW